MPPTATPADNGAADAAAAPRPPDPSLDPNGPPDDLLINCWSGPRCCSTSLMYSFAQRSDTAVADEPLYASFLTKTGAPRPYRSQVLSAQSSDAATVVRDVLRLGQTRGGCSTTSTSSSSGSGGSGRKVMYAKHMSKHKIGVPPALWTRAKHVLLVRDPAPVLQSFAKVLPPTLFELGYPSLLEIVSELRAAGRPPPVVVLSDDLARRPEATLKALCRELNLPFERAMLSWPAGPKPYDGVWAGYWYGGTHRSTCFDVGVREGGKEPLSDALKPLLGECWPMYEALRAMAIGPLETPAGGGVGGGTGTTPTAMGATSVPRPLLPGGASGTGGATSGGGRGGGGGAENHPHPHPHPHNNNQQHVSTHAFAADPRNASVLVGIRDGSLPSHQPSARGPKPLEGSSAALLAASSPPPFDLVWRPLAKVSVLDSAFMLGDGLWEGLRVKDGVVLFARQHLDRLWEGLRALDFKVGMTKTQLLALVHATLDANVGMAAKGSKGVHVRLMVSRGVKATPYQDPGVTIGLPTVVCLPEWKKPLALPYKKGIRLATVHVRRGNPDVQDPTLNTHSKWNCIAACVAAKKTANADEALMLDPRGFVATCNSTNFFIVRDGGELWTAKPTYLRKGVTRENVLRVALAGGLAVRERDFSLAEVYSAEEAFVTGTFGGVVPVREVDGHAIGDWRAEEGGGLGGEGGGGGEAEDGDEDEEGGLPALLAGDAAGPVTRALAQAYADLCAREAAAGRSAALAALAASGGGGGGGAGGGGGSGGASGGGGGAR
jgi:branched-chain amino acid aminotransferase